jgi:hypothetical protein
MRFALPVATAILIGLTMPALGAQSPATETPTTGGAIATTTPGVDLARLPVNVGRIGRQLKQAQVREERDGLKIRYTIEVYGELPKIQYITPLDNILTGDVPRTSPTHADMIRMMTPQEFSTPPLFGVSIPRTKK